MSYKIFQLMCTDKGRGCNHGEEIKNLPISPDWEVVIGGGRNPEVLAFDPEVYEVEYLSASYNVSKIEGEVARIATSPHGCWKVKKHQAWVLVRKED